MDYIYDLFMNFLKSQMVVA